MNIKTGLTALLLTTLPLLANAGAREELMALEATKTASSADAAAINASTIPVPAPASLMALPDGRRANMKDYAVVLFMQAHCQYSAKFDPLLKGWADEHDIRVYPYTLDGGGDVSYPTPMIPRKTDLKSPIADEIVTFFGNGLPIATPTAFMVNVNTLKAYPLTQGVMNIPALESRMASLIQADMDNVDPKMLPPMPASAQVTPQ
ncbi:type-F conjugative transfer system pilin assembly thiol-disulfide isomerase TrbB [Enterobacter sp. MGH 23]|uniref:F-type conjugal transfer protein TrbB n=1 Tax=Enterobacter cloacae complex TaxID=354276 RepID=UPI0003BE1251|nr:MULTISPECIES: F-type conjugal transfer protein TrbB [Enterobacter cloacae complex]ESN20250.1 type-F conjugative transfer system pilin assembly thiol-disulfide isomerase TrbB [Enterobacter sp. MGH 23]KZQ04984.1 conjugal transfer protein TrbB [Enterobacter chengduensis]MDK9985962.1 F-type conjugal transfer protein TrbB [Enterobacter asburiae]MDK9994801.1 F-type conjugal transfer protein TrbB [Enterobacter asburiae]